MYLIWIFFFFFQGRQVRIVGIYLAVTLVDTKKCFVFEHLQKVAHISSLFFEFVIWSLHKTVEKRSFRKIFFSFKKEIIIWTIWPQLQKYQNQLERKIDREEKKAFFFLFYCWYLRLQENLSANNSVLSFGESMKGLEV